MDIEDKHITNIISKDSQENVTVPSWNSMSSSVKKQNFLIFGLRHFNIYSLCILLLFICTSIFGYRYYIESNNSTITPTEIQVLKNNRNTTESNSITADTLPSKKQETPATKKSKLVEQDITIEKTIAPAEIIEVKETKVKPIETVTQQAKTNQTVTPTKPKGKTIIVYQTDTVIQYDTLKVDKKRRNRK